MTMKKCPKCDSTSIDAGKILSAGATVYRSGRFRFGPLSSNCSTYVCLECGYEETYVDQEYLEKVRVRS